MQHTHTVHAHWTRRAVGSLAAFLLSVVRPLDDLGEASKQRVVGKLGAFGLWVALAFIGWEIYEVWGSVFKAVRTFVSQLDWETWGATTVLAGVVLVRMFFRRIAYFRRKLEKAVAWAEKA